MLALELGSGSFRCAPSRRTDGRGQQAREDVLEERDAHVRAELAALRADEGELRAELLRDAQRVQRVRRVLDLAQASVDEAGFAKYSTSSVLHRVRSVFRRTEMAFR